MVSSSCPAPPSPPCALLWRGALPPMEPHSLDIQGGCVLCARIALQAATCAFFGRGWGARILRPCTAVNANVTTIRLAGGAASRLAAPQDPLAARPALQCGAAGAPSPLAHSWASARRSAAAPRVCALRIAGLRGRAPGWTQRPPPRAGPCSPWTAGRHKCAGPMCFCSHVLRTQAPRVRLRQLSCLYAESDRRLERGRRACRGWARAAARCCVPRLVLVRFVSSRGAAPGLRVWFMLGLWCCCVGGSPCRRCKID